MKNTRATKQKRRISFEKKVALQSIAAVVLLVYCIAVAKTDISIEQKGFLHKAVNITADRSDIKSMTQTAMDLSRKAIVKCGEYFDAIIYFCNNGFGEQPQANSVMARELPEPAIYPQPQSTEAASDAALQNSEIQQTEQTQFRYPVVGEITSPFGARIHPVDGSESTHYGVDIAANHGDGIVASLPGTVSETGYDSNLGNYVKVRHSDSMETVYGHMSQILVAKDDVVNSDTRIGLVGATGAATGPHVHLEVRIDGVCRDPMEYLPQV